MTEYIFEDLVIEDKGFLRGPFGGDLKKSIFVPSSSETYKVYEQGVVLRKDQSIGRYYITKEYFDTKMYRFEVRPYDFLISCSGVNYGAIFQLDKNAEKGIINQALLRVRLNYELVNDDFFLYYFRHHIVRLIVGKKGDSTIPNFPPISYIRKLKIPLPPLPEQESIGKFFRIIDKKIELNNRINAELESMAKLIYDYWFVQFDFPDEQGRPYKSSGGKMVYNEKLKREIPKGWEVKRIIEIATTGSGATPLSTRKEYYENGTIPWINSGELNEPFIINTSNYITKLGFESSSTKIYKKGTIIMAMYGATAGKVSLLNLEACTNQAVCAIIPHNDDYKIFIKYSLQDLYNYLIKLSSGSARDNLSQDKIKNLKVPVANNFVLRNYSTCVEPMMNRILRNLEENLELSKLRDWLLPMLMNGQVTVK